MSRLATHTFVLTRWFRGAFQDNDTALDIESRRAFALLYSLQLSGDATALRAVLQLGGERAIDGSFTYSRQTCRRLARTLRTACYPLSDEGIARFRNERGLGSDIQIDRDTALAYARYAQKREAIINLTASDWQNLTLEQQRALEILVHLGHDPEKLIQLRQKIGIVDSNQTPAGQILIGYASLSRFLAWLHSHQMFLHDEGLKQFVKSGLIAETSALSSLAMILAATLLDNTAPPHDYGRICCNAEVINRRTLHMLRTAELVLRSQFPLILLKGSYVTAGRGAHPHIGGGVVDLATHIHSDIAIEHAIQVLRRTGFAAWYRPRPHRPHIHAVAIGDQEMSAAAQWQVRAYFHNRDGRGRGLADPHGGPSSDLPAWVNKYRVSLY